MNKKTNCLTAVIACAMLASSGFAQTTTAVTYNLLSKIQQPSYNAADTFNISFGSLNGGLLSLANDKSGVDGAAAFFNWYGNNSRSLVNWNGVVGAGITPESDDYYRQGTFTSIWSNTQDNQALAFVSHSTASVVDSIALFDLGFAWANPADTGSYPLGAYDAIDFYAGQATAIYGAADASAGTFGTLTTSSVPEPSSASLLLLGGVALAAVCRFRKNV
ncbi:MAG: PEP-CTERM sorting domain-containing protein [Aliarcobacter sp.]